MSMDRRVFYSDFKQPIETHIDELIINKFKKQFQKNTPFFVTFKRHTKLNVVKCKVEQRN